MASVQIQELARIDLSTLPKTARLTRKWASAQGEIATAERRASLLLAWSPETYKRNIAEFNIRLVDSVAEEGLNLRDPAFAKQRRVYIDAATAILHTVGLGRDALGQFDLRRKVLGRLIGRGVKQQIPGESFNSENLQGILMLEDFQTQARRTLVELAGSDTTWGVGARRDASLLWINVGMHYSYLNALRLILSLGSSIRVEGQSVSLDQALGMA